MAWTEKVQGFAHARTKQTNNTRTTITFNGTKCAQSERVDLVGLLFEHTVQPVPHSHTRMVHFSGPMLQYVE